MCKLHGAEAAGQPSLSLPPPAFSGAASQTGSQQPRQRRARQARGLLSERGESREWNGGEGRLGDSERAKGGGEREKEEELDATAEKWREI